MDTQWVFPGWHAGIVGQQAKLSGKLMFVETANPSNILLEIQLKEYDKYVMNDEYVMEYGRIAGAYEAVGKSVGKLIRKAE